MILTEPLGENKYFIARGAVYMEVCKIMGRWKMAALRIPKELNRLFGLGIIFLMLTSIPQIGAQGEQKEQIIFQDDFEAYDIGTFPSKGGWELVRDGRGAEYQVITDTNYHSPTRSLQLLGSYSWSSVARKRFSTNASIIGFEAYVMVEDYPAIIACPVGFWNKDKALWGKYYAYVSFDSNRYIRASSPIEVRNLQPYVPGRWYKIRLVLDRSTNTFSVWINDKLKASGIKTENAYEIDALELSSGWGSYSGVKCYFDDVRVFTTQLQAQPEWYQWYLSVRLDDVVLNDLAFILFAGAVAAGFLAYSRRRRGVPAAATVAVAARTPPSGESAQPPVERAAAIAEAPLDPLRAELREYENYLKRLESLRAEGKVSEHVYQALKKEYEARIEELKKKLGIPDTSEN